MRANLEQRLTAYHKPDYKETVGKIIDSMFVESTPEKLRAEIKSTMLSAPQHVMATAQEGMWAPDVWKEDQADVPALFLIAKRPSIPPDTETYLRRLFPRLEYRDFEGVGHFLMMEDPARINRALLDFLDRTSSRSAAAKIKE
jgi:pimeloyl-ACP methyl ester carboxylesterase